MRIISRNTLIKFWQQFPESEQSLKSWYDEALNAKWNSPNELKEQYKNCSILTKKRVVFNICGNKYRLIVDVEFRIKIIFIVWIGSHEEYNKINAKEIGYAKPD